MLSSCRQPAKEKKEATETKEARPHLEGIFHAPSPCGVTMVGNQSWATKGSPPRAPRG